MIALRLFLNFVKIKRSKEFIFILFCFFLTTTLSAQTAKKLQILLPGMTAAPGTGNGYEGEPTDQTTGIPFDVIVNAVDDNWNVVPINDLVSLTSSDELANLPLPKNLVNGTATFTVTLNSNGSYSITANDDSDSDVVNVTSPPVKVVKIDHFAISAIGDPYTGIPGQVKAGEEISSVEVTAKNDNGDRVSKYNGWVYLSQLTDYGRGRITPEVIQMANGRWQGDIKVFRAGKKRAAWGVTGDAWIKAFDGLPEEDVIEISINADDYYELYVNGKFIDKNSQYNIAQTYLIPYKFGDNVIAIKGRNNGGASGLIVEVKLNGKVILRSDRNWLSSSIADSGWTDVDFNDASWNLSNDLGEYGVSPWGKDILNFPSTSQAHWIWGDSDDSYFRSTFYLDESTIPDRPSYTPHVGESNRFCVIPESFNQLLTLLPGETHKPGSRNGKEGAPSDQQAGQSFFVDVLATDEYFNQIKDIDDIVSISSSDSQADLPLNRSMEDGELKQNVTLYSPGYQTITATDVTNDEIEAGISSNVKILEGIDGFVISTIPTTQVAGQAFSVTITAVNQNGVPVSNYNGILDLSCASESQIISPNVITIENGVWNGDITVTKSGSYVTVSVQDRMDPPHTGESNQFTVQPGTTTKLQILMPGETATPGIAPGKTGSVNEVLAGTGITVQVNAVDAWWNVTNSTDVVRITSSDQDAILPPDAALNAGSKNFVVTLNTTGLQTVYSIDVSDTNITSGNSSQIRVNPANLHHFAFDHVSGPKKVGTPFSVTIRAMDVYDNVIPDYSGLVNLSVSTGKGTIVPITANLQNGYWSGNVTLKKASGGVYLTASDGASPPHTGSSNQFDVEPGPLKQLLVLVPGLTATPGLSPGYTGTPQSQNSGVPFSITVNGVDEYWNVVHTANDSFAVSSTDTSASLPMPTHLVNGSRNLSITLVGDGSHTISAFHLKNQDIANGQSPYIAVLPQNLDHFTISQINGSVTAGEAFEITVRAETNTNTVIYNFNDTVDLSASTGSGTVIPHSIGPFVQGEWTGEIILTKAESGVTISASDQATPPHSGTSNQFSVAPGSFEKLQVLLPGETAQPGISPGKLGTPLDQQTAAQFDVTVRAVDQYWNLISQASDSVSITTSDESAMLPGKSKLISGKATFPLVMGSPGTHTVTSIDESNNSILAGMSSAFNVSPGSLDHFEFQTIGDQVAGNDFQVQIKAADQAGNPVVGFNGHARIQSTTGEGTFSPTEIMFVDGLWTGNITITRAANNVQLTCLDYAATPHSGQSDPFTITAGEFTRLQILLPGETNTPGIAPGKTGEIETQISGEALAVTINAVDNWWNPVNSVTDTVGLTSTDDNANLPLEAALKSGTITLTDMRFNTPGYWTVTAYCSSNPNISSDTSPLVHVITGSVASFQFEPINSPQIAGDSIYVSIKAVDGNGTPVTNYNEMASITSSTGPGTILIDDVQFSDGEWSGAIVLTKAVQSAHLNIHDFEDIVRGNSNPFIVLPGDLANLQIILPGETGTPGLKQAKKGTPQTQTLGVPFQIKVNATDTWWNLVDPENFSLHFSSSDSIASLPTDTVQHVSSKTYPVTMLTEGENQIYLTSQDDSSLSDTSSTFYIGSGQIDHFVFSQIDTHQVAGKAFPLRIEAYNEYNNPVTDYSGEIILSASTGNGTISKTGVTLENGFWEGSLYITRASEDVVLYAADYIPSPNTHTGYSNKFHVSPDSLTDLQVLWPGETATPGVSPGKTGSPTLQTAGTAVNVTVRAIDAYWNTIPTIFDTLSVQISDTFAVFSDNIPVENGISQFPVTIRAAGYHIVSVECLHHKRIPYAASDSLLVHPNTFSQLLLLLPGEQLLPGDTENDPLNTPGRKNNPTAQTSGLLFTTKVFAVDDYWNPISTAPSDTIRLFTTDNTAAIEPLDTVLVNGKARFSVTLNQGGNQVLRAINESNSTIRSSLDGVTEVLVGGIHYEIVLDTNKVSAGEMFDMEVFYKNGVGEKIPGANHLVRLSAVSSNDLDNEVAVLDNSSFNLQAGYRKIEQKCNKVGIIRIKIEDDIGTDISYSDPLEIVPGQVAAIEIDSVKTEIRGEEETDISVKLSDGAGNPVSGKQVQFSMVEGSGQLQKTSVHSDENGIASVGFVGGQSTEVNVVRAQFDSIYVDIEIVINLTPSTLADGVLVNYPNPFGVESPVTHIDYYLPEDADVTLQIFDLFGNLVWKKEIEAGMPGGKGRNGNKHPNSVEWNGENNKGQKVGNGGYILICRAVANGGKVVMEDRRKIAVLR